MHSQDCSSKLTHLALGGALVLAGYMAGGGRSDQLAFGQTSTHTSASGDANAWGVAVESNGWVVVKGADGLAYKVTQTGWTTAGAAGQGPLALH